MKTTLEIPHAIFRRMKSKAAEQGIPLREFVTEAVKDKLKIAHSGAEKPWMKHVGKLKHLCQQTKRINKAVKEQFERIDPEIWD